MGLWPHQQKAKDEALTYPKRALFWCPRFVDRYWAKVAITPGCWLWAAAKTDSGYGVIGDPYQPKRVVRATQVMELWKTGEWPELDVCHTCDTPACVRPEHLWQGTAKQNAQDMVAKGRHNPSYGEANYWSKLTEDQVRTIRFLCDTKAKTHRAIATEFGITNGIVSRIGSRKKWGWLV